MTAPIPIDVLATAQNLIRQAIAADASGTALPPVPDAMLSQAIEGWRTSNPAPQGAVSLVDKAASLLNMIIKDLYEPFRTALPNGRIDRPRVTDAGLSLETVAAISPIPANALFLIEEYRATSFLGKYGVGRTLSTMSLLPGEETTIRLKTWRNTSTTRTDTSSVVDSEDVTVSDRFADQLSKETTDTATQQASTSWHVEASASASWGWGSADLSAGASGETQTGRESFARTASEQVRENAREARSQRKTEVTTSSTTAVTAGDEDSIERVVKNVNLRRTLNFLFRELNQEYITRLHLTGVRFAHCTPGKQGTWTEYPLTDLPKLLDRLILPAKRQSVAASILGVVATIHDRGLAPVQPLQLVTVGPGGAFTVTDLKPTANGLNQAEMPIKGSGRFVRWKPGPLAPAGANPENDPQTPADRLAVDGVLLSEQSIVMPTGAILVEAVLGERDAVDDCVMRAQEAELAASEARNGRESLLNAALADLEPEERVRAYAEATFGPDGSQQSQPVEPG
jgi:hypothetical protein